MGRGAVAAFAGAEDAAPLAPSGPNTRLALEELRKIRAEPVEEYESEGLVAGRPRPSSGESMKLAPPVDSAASDLAHGGGRSVRDIALA